MQELTLRQRRRILQILESGGRLSGLHLCLHDFLMVTGLPIEWREHQQPRCRQSKAENFNACHAYCGAGGAVDREVAGNSEAIVLTCPFGCTEIIAPVIHEGMVAGMLFCGVCWNGRGRPLEEGMPVVPDRQWLLDRQVLVTALARQIASVMRGEEGEVPVGRAADILRFLEDNIERAPRLTDLAASLNLSPSRAGHLVKALFRRSFTGLRGAARLNRAARYLSMSDMPVSEIAARLGFSDQSHLTRAFRQHFKMAPSAYRRKHHIV